METVDKFLYFNVHQHPLGDLVKMQVSIQEILSGAQESAFKTLI